MSEEARKLEEQIKIYLEADQDYQKADAELREIPLIEKPITFGSIDEAAAYSFHCEEITNMREQCLGSRKVYAAAMDKAESAILKMLPYSVRNTWIKVGDYGVGFYLDSWGGDHYRVKIQRWQEKMPDISDRTYYP